MDSIYQYNKVGYSIVKNILISALNKFSLRFIQCFSVAVKPIFTMCKKYEILNKIAIFYLIMFSLIHIKYF